MDDAIGGDAFTLPAVLLFSLVSLTALAGCAGDRSYFTDQTMVRRAGSAAGSPDPNDLLVVITYGKGWSAQGWGDGLRDVAAAIRERYPNRQVITRAWDDHDGIDRTIESHPGPVALVGHSFGGCRSVEIANRVRHPIDWMVLLDPVPCDDWFFRHPGKYFRVPTGVHQAVCYYHPSAIFPVSYSIANPSSAFENRPRDLGHGEFCHNDEVRQHIFDLCGRTNAGALATATAAAPSDPSIAR
ncbi:MAG TPA: hypothetical protein VH475_00675 [Tepidisphaeraceae bacterium]|jgi:pimeloyl-ACP methyl ester carboxylesterase